LVPQKICDSDGRQSFAGVVSYNDFVDAYGFPERDRGAGPRDPALGDAFGVRRIDINSDSVSTDSGVNSGGDAPQGFSQNDVCSAVQNPYDLTIALDRHTRYRALGGNLEKFDPHLPRQFATAR
jgi:hypothetical protein